VIYTIVAVLVGVITFVLMFKHVLETEFDDKVEEIGCTTVVALLSVIAGLAFPLSIAIIAATVFAKWYRARRKRLNDITRQAREPHGESPYRSEV
jgi:hypothetical protein